MDELQLNPTVTSPNSLGYLEEAGLLIGSSLGQTKLKQYLGNQQSIFSLPEDFRLQRLDINIDRNLVTIDSSVAIIPLPETLPGSTGSIERDPLTGQIQGVPLLQPEDATSTHNDKILVNLSGQERVLNTETLVDITVGIEFVNLGKQDSDSTRFEEGVEKTITTAITLVATQLKQFAADPQLITKLQTALGDSWDVEAGRMLIERLADETASSPLVKLEILPTPDFKSQGAFAAQTNTIYLFEDFLIQAIGKPDIVAAVLLEELGHYLDTQLNASDSAGDEGAIFAAIVAGQALEEQALQTLKAENDFANLIVGDQQILVEYSSPAGISPGLVRQWGASGDVPFQDSDFDGDGRADMVVWRPSTQRTYVLTSSSNWTSSLTLESGAPGDIPQHNSDFDGDGKADIAVWRPNDGSWHILPSRNNWSRNNIVIRYWGSPGDTPLQDSDFDGDGRTDTAVFNPNRGSWDVLFSSQNWAANMTRYWGSPGDIPQHNSDFDGDGRTDMTVYNPNNGIWYVLFSSQNWAANMTRKWGDPGDIPLQDSDFDGDGKTDMAVWRPSTGVMYTLLSTQSWNSGFARALGQQGDLLLHQSDFDRDGKTDLALWRPSTGTWHVLTSSSSWTGGFEGFLGEQGDIPIQHSDFNGDLRDDLAVWRPSNGTWYAMSIITNPILTAALETDTGANNRDTITFDPTVAGTIRSATRITRFRAGVDGKPMSQFVNVLGNLTQEGSFRFSRTSLEAINGGPLTQGAHRLSLVAEDGFGNTTELVEVPFTLDSVAPLLNLTTPVASTPLNAQSKLTGTVNGTGSAIAALQYRFDDLAAISVGVNAAGAFDQAFNLTGINDGQHTLTMAATDSAGNIAIITSTVMISRAPAPIISLALQQDSAPNGGTNSDLITANPAVLGQITSTARVVEVAGNLNNSAVSSFKPLSTTLTAEGKFALERSQLAALNNGTLPDGTYSLFLRAKNEFGTWSQVANTAFTLDTAQPLINLTTPIASAPLNAVSRLSGTVNGTGSAVTTLQYQFDNLELKTVAFDEAGIFDQSFDFTGINRTGPHTLTLKAIDTAGNERTTAFNAILSAAALPPLRIALKQDTARGGQMNDDRLTADPTLLGQASAGQVVEIAANFGSSDVTGFKTVPTTIQSDGSFTIDKAQLAILNGGSLPDDTYKLHLRAKQADGAWSEVIDTSFTLDTTTPELEVNGLINGITWRAGDKLKGKLKTLESGTTVVYRFDAQAEQVLTLSEAGAFEQSLDEKLAEFLTQLQANDTPNEAQSHKLEVTSFDSAGNTQSTQFDFLIRENLQASDDDEPFGSEPQNSGGAPGGGSAGGTGYDWSNWGGGTWGRGGNVSSSNPLSDGNPSGGNPPSGDPYGYGEELPSYLEKVALILDEAVQSIDNIYNPQLSREAILQKQAALMNRTTVLMEVATMVDKGGFYDWMEPVLHGIYDEANNDPVRTRYDAKDEGWRLARDLVQDADAVKTEVYQSTLLAVVNQVLIDKGYIPDSWSTYQPLVDALLELGRTYAALNPREAANVSVTPDFLDSLYRAQKLRFSPEQNRFVVKTVEEVQDELKLGISALDTLLGEATGEYTVEWAIQTIQLVNTLLQAATNVESLSAKASLGVDAIRDAEFLRQLVAFGFEYAKLNPTNMSSLERAVTDAFFAVFWQQAAIDSTTGRQAIGKFSNLFETLDTLDKQKKIMSFEKRLLKAAGQFSQVLQEEKRDQKFLSKLIELGGDYISLTPTTLQSTDSFKFLTDVWNAQNEIELAEAAANFQAFVSAQNIQTLVADNSLSFNAARSFSFSTQDVNELIQALQISNYSHRLLASYSVYNVNLYDQDSTRMIIVNTQTNQVEANTSYPIGNLFNHTSPSGYTYPYILVLHEGQLTYYPEGVSVPYYPGDRILAPQPGTSNFPTSLLQSYLIDQVLEPLLDFSKTLGQFILGAIYQFSVDQGEPLRAVLSLDSDVQQWLENAEQATEQTVLPDTVAFQAGRLFGDGAAVALGILEIVEGISIGVGGTGAGASLCITGIGCIAGAPAVAVSVAVGSALVVQGVGTVEAGAIGALERINTLMAITGGSGSTPQAGDPVPGIPNVTYGPSRNNSNQADIDYEIRVTGKSTDEEDLAVYANGKEFDWFDGTTLLDAKNWNKGGINDVTRTDSFIQNVRIPNIVEDATEQVNALRGTGATRIEWRVANEEVANALQDLFNDNGIGIDVTWYP